MKPINIRTDFADEVCSMDYKGSSYDHKETSNDYVIVHTINIKDENNELGKQKGSYVSVEFKEMDDAYKREKIIEAFGEQLQTIIDKNQKKIERILVIGLGNKEIVSDALGPNTIDQILVTAHLFELEGVSQEDGVRNVAAIAPGVMGQTGLESASIVHALTKEFKPDIILAVDALATKNTSRINRVIQITDTGIMPGSGVGNHRLAINKESLGVDVIAIGVATVTSIGAIIEESFSVISEDEDMKDKLFEEIQKQNQLDLMVTPKSMDHELEELVEIVSESINTIIHPNYKNL